MKIDGPTTWHMWKWRAGLAYDIARALGGRLWQMAQRKMTKGKQ